MSQKRRNLSLPQAEKKLRYDVDDLSMNKHPQPSNYKRDSPLKRYGSLKSGVSDGDNVIVIAGHHVIFPKNIKPFPTQLHVMNKILAALDSESHILVESPTGTGKTLAILCSVLSWYSKKMEEYNNLIESQTNYNDDNSDFESDVPPSSIQPPVGKIYYLTRTHTQIKQVISEYKRSKYSKHLNMAIFASKKRLCIYKRVSDEENAMSVEELCTTLRNNGSCPYDSPLNKRQFISSLPKVYDIEELARVGQQCDYCPYFGSRFLAEKVDIVFLPYQYIINPMFRESTVKDISKSVLIFDEAHNISQIARESYSVSIPMESLMNYSKAYNNIICRYPNSAREQLPMNELKYIHDFVCNLCMWNDQVKEDKIIYTPRQTASTASYFDMLKTFCYLDRHNYGEYISSIMAVMGADEGILSDLTKALSASLKDPLFLSNLEQVGYIFSYLFLPQYEQYFRICFDIDDSNTMNNGKRNIDDSNNNNNGNYNDIFRDNSQSKKCKRRFRIMCLKGEVAFDLLRNNSHSIILASGTLAPLDGFSTELNTDFRFKVEASHCINTNEQLRVIALHGSDNAYSFLGTKKFLHSDTYISELCTTILDICKIVPGGILCFLSSYLSLNEIQRYLKYNVKELNKIKRIFYEPSGDNKIDDFLKKFYRTVDSHGAILFAVFRGKMSEGIDFSNQYCRCVISVGIPYPNLGSLEVILKKEFQNMLGPPHLNANQWYEIEAFRAVNQAIGRCIRNRNDYGSIVLLDNRFNIPKNVNYLSKWLRSTVVQSSNLASIKDNLTQFFQDNNGKKSFSPKPTIFTVEDGPGNINRNNSYNNFFRSGYTNSNIGNDITNCSNQSTRTTSSITGLTNDGFAFFCKSCDHLFNSRIVPDLVPPQYLQNNTNCLLFSDPQILPLFQKKNGGGILEELYCPNCYIMVGYYSYPQTELNPVLFKTIDINLYKQSFAENARKQNIPEDKIDSDFEFLTQHDTESLTNAIEKMKNSLDRVKIVYITISKQILLCKILDSNK